MNQVPFSWPQLIVMIVGGASVMLSHLGLTQRLSVGARKAVTFALATLGAVVTQVAYDADKPVKVYIGAILYAWIAAVVLHFTGIPDAINSATPNLGIGPKTYEVHAGVKVHESDGPPDPPKSRGPVTQPRQSKMRTPRNP